MKEHYILFFFFLKKKKEALWPLFYGSGSTASRLEPLWGGSLLFTTKSPEIPGKNHSLARDKFETLLGNNYWPKLKVLKRAVSSWSPFNGNIDLHGRNKDKRKEAHRYILNNWL